MRVSDLERKILNNVPLSPDEMRVVGEALLSPDTEERILSCEALLRLGNAPQKDQAVLTLGNLLREVNSAGGQMSPNFFMALLSVPEAVLEKPEFKTCLTNAAKHSDEGIRVNCMAALTPLVKTGSTWAVELLKGALHDSSELVRQNARAGLRLAPG